jgi:hypothetical protein
MGFRTIQSSWSNACQSVFGTDRNLVDCGVVIGFPNGSIFLFGCPSGKIAAGVLEGCMNVLCKLGIVVDEITLRGVPLAPEMMIANKGI